MKRLLLGSLAAAVVVFLWGFIFWGTPLSSFMMSQAPDATALHAEVAAALPETGVYFLPDATMGEEAAALHRSGPIMSIYYHAEGAEPMSAGTFVMGYLHLFVSILLMGLLLRMALPALPTFGRRVAFVALAGLAATVWTNLGEPVWFFHPWTYELGTAFYDVVAWALAGAVLARLAVPQAEAAAAPVGA